MDSILVANLEYCGEIVRDTLKLLYYSHFITIICSLFIATFVLLKSQKPSAARLLFLLATSLSVWAAINLVVWVKYDQPAMMTFLWSFFGIFYLLTFVFAYILFSIFLEDKKDISLKEKILLTILLLPVIIFLPFPANTVAYDAVNCIVTEGIWYSKYYYLASFIIILATLVKGLVLYRKQTSVSGKRKVGYMLIGLMPFLLLFFSIGFLVSYLVGLGYIGEFGLELYSLLGTPLFVAILGYLIVQYKAFDIKLIGAQAIVVALVFIIGSQFFFIQSTLNFVLNTAGFILIIIAGFFLIRSVKKEVERKEELEVLSHDLARANERLKEMDKQKSEFISIASHQLRTPLTAIKGYVSLLLEGSYGTMSKDMGDVLNKIYSVNDRLVHLVEDLLNVSRIEAGRIQYNFQPTQLATIVTELHDMFGVTAKNKGLAFNLSLPQEKLPLIMADPNKLKEITSNLIDNAIKYTPSGSVNVSLEKVGENARIVIADTGIGIKPEDMNNLFNKFVRSKETSRMVVGGAGLGLYVGKSFVLAHGGKIWAESEGAGKGSTFIIELPINNPNLKAGTVEKKQEG